MIINYIMSIRKYQIMVQEKYRLDYIFQVKKLLQDVYTIIIK